MRLRRLGDFLFVNVSAKATNLPGSGHGYWFHSMLTEGLIRRKQNVISLVSKRESGGLFTGVLGFHRDTPSLSALLPLLPSILDVRRVIRETNKVNSKERLFHFYEGGYREFLTACLLLSRVKGSACLFNFNLTDPWPSLLRSDSWLSSLIVSSLKRLTSSLGSRMVFLSESVAMAELIGSALGRKPVFYPLFSSIPGQAKPGNILTDMTFFPMGEEELNLCLKIHESVSQRISSVRAELVTRWGSKISDGLKVAAEIQGLKIQIGRLNQEEYESVYSRTRIAVLPYTGDYYKFSSSGRLLDAAASGCWVTAPEGSQTAMTIAKLGLGQSFDPENLEPLVEWIVRILTESVTSDVKLDFSIDQALNKLDTIFSSETLSANQVGSDRVRFYDLVLVSLAVWATPNFHGLGLLSSALRIPAWVVQLFKKSLKIC